MSFVRRKVSLTVSAWTVGVTSRMQIKEKREVIMVPEHTGKSGLRQLFDETEVFGRGDQLLFNFWRESADLFS